jgi:hypothetical protein
VAVTVHINPVGDVIEFARERLDFKIALRPNSVKLVIVRNRISVENN